VADGNGGIHARQVHAEKGQDRVSLRPEGSNGETIAQSQVYTTKNAAINGIESVKKTPPRKGGRPDRRVSLSE
jgi:uncharacterized protein YegP (UPF0339 family)